MQIFGETVALTDKSEQRSFYAAGKARCPGWNKVFVAGGFLSTPRRSHDIDPTGSLVASTLVALVFDKALQQNWSKAVAAVPVIG